MIEINIERKSLDSQEFLKLRHATDTISKVLAKRLKDHLLVLKPLFIPRKLLGTYIKSSSQQEIHGSDKAFARLQEEFAAICEKPFGLPRKLQAPLPAISNQLESTPFQYSLTLEDDEEKSITITSPARFILSYQSECPINRLQGMLAGTESRQVEDMRQSIINHIAMVILLEQFPALTQLLKDLRYEVEIKKLPGLGNLPVVILTAPLTTFLPPDKFIVEVTQLSGIPAFQEIIDMNALENIPDPLTDALTSATT